MIFLALSSIRYYVHNILKPYNIDPWLLWHTSGLQSGTRWRHRSHPHPLRQRPARPCQSCTRWRCRGRPPTRDRWRRRPTRRDRNRQCPRGPGLGLFERGGGGGGGGGKRPLVPLLLLSPPFFLIIFCVHHPVNLDGRHLLVHTCNGLTSQSYGSRIKNLPNLHEISIFDLFVKASKI
jgi:hypothetical protein